jgi:hypothetical protein
MTTFKTVLHHYNFPSAAHPGYKAMVARIKANADGRGHWLHAWGGQTKHDSSKDNTSEVVEVEAAHVFGNQWNTADGRRVFDWYEEYIPNNRPEKRGHWLEITPEMAELRRVTLKCGYCGCQFGPHHKPAPGTFCSACLDSEYLKPDDLHLLRLMPVIEDETKSASYPALTDEERAALMPRYIERQTTGTDSRAKKKRDKQRADVLAKFEKETTAATEERDGMLWLWDHGVSLDNVIYYSHTRKFSFGWRSAVSPEVKSALLDLLCEFPFAYEIKATDEVKATR